MKVRKTEKWIPFNNGGDKIFGATTGLNSRQEKERGKWP